jgi:hypothetical protein
MSTPLSKKNDRIKIMSSHRSILLLSLLWLAAGCESSRAISNAQADASTVSSKDGGSASMPDASFEPDLHPSDSAVQVDLHVFDSTATKDTTCTSMTYKDYGDTEPGGPYYCPIDPTLPECFSADKGALVARSNDCLDATRQAHPDCSPWSHDFTFELVILEDPFDGCMWPITVDAVLDCGDHVQIDFSVTAPCTTCDAPMPLRHILHLPNDPKPVHAQATLQMEYPCR